MYCPQCGAQNEARHRYCRQCGKLLSTVRLALDGSIDESIAKFKQGGNSLTGGVVTLGVFLFIAIVIYLFGGTEAAAIDVILGIIISSPMIVKGILTLEKAEKRLNNVKPTETGVAEITAQDGKRISAAQTTDSLEVNLKKEFSITEDATLRWKHPEREK